MADTIITNSPDKNGSDSGAGWVVALVVVIVLVVGGTILYRRGVFTATPPANNTINVTVPNPVDLPN